MSGYDVFICWAWADGRPAAERVQAALEARGLTVFRDETHGGVYEPLGPSVERALAASRTLVAIATPGFADSPHCRDELHTALMAGYHLDGDSRRVLAVPLGVGSDDIRPRELATQRLPAEGFPVDELAAAIAARVAETTEPFGAAPPRPDPAWYPAEVAPEQPVHGRGAEAWEIHEQLRARTKNARRAHPAVTLRGPGGIGKSALALQYARWFHRDHPAGVVLLRLGGSSGGRVGGGALRARFDEQLALVADRLGVEPTGLPAALDALGGPYLWIVDDVPTGTDAALIAAMAAPTRLGRTLYTSRGLVTDAEVRLAPLEERAAVALLTGHRPPDGHDEAWAARRIARLLGGHPLGLTIAGGLTAGPGLTGYGALLEQLSATEPDRLQTAATLLSDELPPAAARPFAAALLRSFDGAGDAAREMLCAASILAPVPMPHALLVGTVRRCGDLGTFDLDGGLAAATGRGLLERAGPDGYLMHAVVARAVRAWVYPPSRRTRLRDGALAELTAAVDATRNGYRHRTVLPLLPHVRAVAGLMAGGDPWGVGEDERHLMHEAGRVQVEAGETGAAVETFRLLDEACGPDVADAYTRHAVRMGLAVAYEAQGHYERAERLKAEAYAGFAERLAPDDPQLLTARGNLAVARYRLGDLRSAHELLREVYTGARDHPELGRLHPDTLVALGNLAIVRGALGGEPAQRARHRRVAHRYWTAAVDGWRRAAGPDDPRALDARNGLALSLRALERREEALAVARQAHADRMRILGPEHPDTIGTLENSVIIGLELYGGQGDAFTEVLNARLATRPAHPATRNTLANLLHAERPHYAPAGDAPASAYSVADEMPTGLAAGRVRLDGEHAGAEADLLSAAMAEHERRAAAFGPGDSRTMLACAYLAYALALADQFDGQLGSAAILADDAADGLAEAVPGTPAARTAGLIRAWVNDRLAGE
ncbi:tetratricopeptide repeat protein [Dactylosporangium sp. NPDC005572]|uniref:tetratricopeptide repeat protein n=1 Tax=Dactylosporangium sp. NPDC005572 TaxID=3156889 RepID=UPI00339FEE94